MKGILKLYMYCSKLYFEVESQKLTLRGQSKLEHIKMMEIN